MNKIFGISLIAMTVAMPVFASGIDTNTNPAQCNETVLETTFGTSNLEANWSPNVLNLEWYNGNTKLTVQDSAKTCRYDSGITVPSEPPTKEGYTFAGWAVKPPFDLSTLQSSVYTINYASKNFNGGSCFSETYHPIIVIGQNTNRKENTLTTSECSNYPVFSDLGNGEWKLEFEYGTVKGKSLCSHESGSNGWYTNGSWDNNGDWSNTTVVRNLADETGQSSGVNCWCKATGFAEPNSSVYGPVDEVGWVFVYDNNSANCATSCASDCAWRLAQYPGLRSAAFGTTE